MKPQFFFHPPNERFNSANIIISLREKRKKNRYECAHQTRRQDHRKIQTKQLPSFLYYNKPQKEAIVMSNKKHLKSSLYRYGIWFTRKQLVAKGCKHDRKRKPVSNTSKSTRALVLFLTLFAAASLFLVCIQGFNALPAIFYLVISCLSYAFSNIIINIIS